MLHCHLNAIQASRVYSSQHQIGVGIRVAGTKLKTGSHRILQIADQTCQNRTVTGRHLRAVSQRSNDAYRCLEARLQTVQGVIGSGNEGVYDLVVLQHAHDSAIAHSAHEVLL